MTLSFKECQKYFFWLKKNILKMVSMWLVIIIAVAFLGVLATATSNAYYTSRQIQNQKADKLAPASEYFFYDKIIPTKLSFGVGEYPSFISYSKVFQPGIFDWYDTLQCKRALDNKVSYNLGTQLWSNWQDVRGYDLASWVWNKNKIDEQYKTCQLLSNILYTTRYGNKKLQRVTTDWFGVNGN